MESKKIKLNEQNKEDNLKWKQEKLDRKNKKVIIRKERIDKNKVPKKQWKVVGLAWRRGE